MGAHTGLRLYHVFHGIACGRRRPLGFLHVELLRARGLPLAFGHHHFAQLVVAVQGYLQCLLAFGMAQHACLRLVAHHGELHRHTVARGKRDVEFTLEVGHDHLALTCHGSQFYGTHVLVAHLSLEHEALGRGLLRGEHKQGDGEKMYKVRFHVVAFNAIAYIIIV